MLRTCNLNSKQLAAAEVSCNTFPFCDTESSTRHRHRDEAPLLNGSLPRPWRCNTVSTRYSVQPMGTFLTRLESRLSFTLTSPIPQHGRPVLQLVSRIISSLSQLRLVLTVRENLVTLLELWLERLCGTSLLTNSRAWPMELPANSLCMHGATGRRPLPGADRKCNGKQAKTNCGNQHGDGLTANVGHEDRICIGIPVQVKQGRR